jgi:hypothetical protein
MYICFPRQTQALFTMVGSDIYLPGCSTPNIDGTRMLCEDLSYAQRYPEQTHQQCRNTRG